MASSHILWSCFFIQGYKKNAITVHITPPMHPVSVWTRKLQSLSSINHYIKSKNSYKCRYIAISQFPKVRQEGSHPHPASQPRQTSIIACEQYDLAGRNFQKTFKLILHMQANLLHKNLLQTISWRSNTITSGKKFFVSVKQAQDIVPTLNIMVDDTTQKFTGKNLSWEITIELEFGESIVVYKESFTTKPTNYRGYFFIMGKKKKKIHVLCLQH